MPASGPVYQPTTVSYETRPASGLLAQTTAVSPLKIFRKPIPQLCLLIFSLLTIAAGIAMIVNGAADYEDTEMHKDEFNTTTAEQSEQIDIGVIVGGALFTIIGIVCLGIYLKFADWRRNLLCQCNGIKKKQGLVRQLQGGTSGGGQILALNPSTDPLVSHTQYAPVSELPRPEDEECRTLMTDNKDCLSSAEESDRMLDPDPRIVLRPVGHVDDA